MTPDSAVAMLDRFLKKDGEDVTLQRVVGTTNQAVVAAPCRAVLRGYLPREIIAGGAIIQGDTKVILSPTDIERAQWPGGQTPSGLDARVPRKGDKIVSQGRQRNIESATPTYLAGELVRIDIQCRG